MLPILSKILKKHAANSPPLKNLYEDNLLYELQSALCSCHSPEWHFKMDNDEVIGLVLVDLHYVYYELSADIKEIKNV